MKFWEQHSQELRKGRLLQAAAILYTEFPNATVSEAVEATLELEREIEKQTKENTLVEQRR